MKPTHRSFLVSTVFLTWLMLSPEASCQWWTYSGGGEDDIAESIIQAPDGGYVVAGWTVNLGAGNKDLLILKLTGSAGIQWQKAFGGLGNDAAYCIQATSDPKYGSGYIVAGETNSSGAGNYDFLLLKLTTDGSIQWKTTLGGSTWDQAYSVIQASDGNYVVAGTTASFGAGAGDILVAKVTIGGGIQWAKAYGQSGYEVAKSIRQTLDGGYILAGWTDSYGAGAKDFLVVKVSSTGNFQWAKTYGGVHSDEAYSIDVMPDNGYVVSGYSYTSTTETQDALILKLSSTGDIQWKKLFGFNDQDDIASSLQRTSDGGFVVENSQFDDCINCDSPNHFYVTKFSSDGSLQWSRIFNPGGIQGANCIRQTSDGGYVLAGEYSGRFLVVKMDSAATLPPPCSADMWVATQLDQFGSTIATGQSVVETTVSLSQGNPGLAAADVTTYQYSPCSLGGACAAQ